MRIGEESEQAFHELLQALRRDRERLAVQVNLAQKELQKELHDEWQVIEQKWDVLEKQLAEFREDAYDTAQRVSNEIRQAYNQLKDKLD